MRMQLLRTSKKAFDRVDWKKLVGILKKIGVDFKERRLLSNLYMKQWMKVRIGGEMSEGREIGWGVRQGCPLSPTLLNIYLEYLMKNCFLNMGGANIGGRRIKCIRIVDDTPLLAEDWRMLKNMLMELNDRCEDYRMNININKTNAMVIGRKPNKIHMWIKYKSVEQADVITLPRTLSHFTR